MIRSVSSSDRAIECGSGSRSIQGNSWAILIKLCTREDSNSKRFNNIMENGNYILFAELKRVKYVKVDLDFE